MRCSFFPIVADCNFGQQFLVIGFKILPRGPFSEVGGDIVPPALMMRAIVAGDLPFFCRGAQIPVAAENFFRCGHQRNAAEIPGNVGTEKAPRIRGFHQVLKENGISDFAKRTFYGASASLADAKHFLRTGLEKFPRTTLIAADSDGSADLVHAAALQLGLECPGRLALTGFGCVTHLPVANVNQNPERQGELAARYLIDYAATGVCSASFCERVETSLTGVECIPIRLS